MYMYVFLCIYVCVHTHTHIYIYNFSRLLNASTSKIAIDIFVSAITLTAPSFGPKLWGSGPRPSPADLPLPMVRLSGSPAVLRRRPLASLSAAALFSPAPHRPPQLRLPHTSHTLAGLPWEVGSREVAALASRGRHAGPTLVVPQPAAAATPHMIPISDSHDTGRRRRKGAGGRRKRGRCTVFHWRLKFVNRCFSCSRPSEFLLHLILY